MAKKTAGENAEKPKKKFSDILNDLEKERQACGSTMTNEQLEFIVKLVKACV